MTKCGVHERIGLLVRVVERCDEGGYDWLTDVQGPGILGRDMHTGKICVCNEVLMHDWNLTPINGMDLRRQYVRHAGERFRERA